MTTYREFFIETLEAELPKFERVFAAIPETHSDYRPDPKSKTAIELAAMLVASAQHTVTFITDGTVDFAHFKPADVTTGTAASAAMREHLTNVLNAAKAASEETWDSEGAMLMGDVAVWKASRGRIAWGMLFDMIHHRGQISTYLRAMGGSVPSIYGGSADEPQG